MPRPGRFTPGVGIATCYGLDGPGIECQARFSAPVQTGPASQSASYAMGSGTLVECPYKVSITVGSFEGKLNKETFSKKALRSPYFMKIGTPVISCRQLVGQTDITYLGRIFATLISGRGKTHGCSLLCNLYDDAFNSSHYWSIV